MEPMSRRLYRKYERSLPPGGAIKTHSFLLRKGVSCFLSARLRERVRVRRSKADRQSAGGAAERYSSMPEPNRAAIGLAEAHWAFPHIREGVDAHRPNSAGCTWPHLWRDHVRSLGEGREAFTSLGHGLSEPPPIHDRGEPVGRIVGHLESASDPSRHGRTPVRP